MAEPSTLPGLALWLDGRQPAYSDAGVTIATVPYGRIAQIVQPAPLSGNWTSTGINRPTREANALDFHFFGPNHVRGSLLTQPASVAISGNNCTIGIAFQQRLGGGQAGALFSAIAGAGTFGAYFSGGVVTLATTGGLLGPPGQVALAPGHYWANCTLIIVCGASQYDIKLTVNGVLYTGSVATVPSSSVLGQIIIGANPAGSLASLYSETAISQFVACASILAGSNLTDLQSFLTANVPDNYPVSAPLVVMAGDSIAAAWLPGVQGDLDATNPTPIRWLNVGVAGAHASFPGELPSFFMTDAAPRYSALRAKNLAICEGISVNDLAYRFLQGDTATQAAASVLAGYYAYLTLVRGTGFIPLVCTLTPNTGGANYDAARVIINASIRANWRSYGIVLADIGATPGMSTSADAANTLYFSDGTHPTVTGYARMDDYVLLPAVTQALLNIVNNGRYPFFPVGYRSLSQVYPRFGYGSTYLPAKTGPGFGILPGSN